jgi:hypothetical protein
MRPSRVALPLREVEKLEKVSDWRRAVSEESSYLF